MTGLERYWYRVSPMHLFLLPVSWLFGTLVALRRWLYRKGLLSSQRLPVPVVIVGNISIGGTGKTPLTLAIAEHLVKLGWHPLIVSRGYGGTHQQQPVSTDSTPQQVGDEPLLMARRALCPVWIGRDRVATAQAALHAHPECNVVLCDDGLQHYRLQRDFEIAVVDGTRGIGNGFLLPAGPLRERASRLNTVDAVVVNGGTLEIGQYDMLLSGVLFHNLKHPEKTACAADFQGLRLHAVAGIGHPQRFFDHLTHMGLAFLPHAFPDHHPYSAADLDFADCDALLLTEKDAVKCAPFADDRYWVLRVDAQIDSALFAHLLRKIAPHGRKTA